MVAIHINKIKHSDIYKLCVTGVSRDITWFLLFWTWMWVVWVFAVLVVWPSRCQSTSFTSALIGQASLPSAEIERVLNCATCFRPLDDTPHRLRCLIARQYRSIESIVWRRLKRLDFFFFFFFFNFVLECESSEHLLPLFMVIWLVRVFIIFVSSSFVGFIKID